MLAQMAATAGSVAVGSTIGHGISSMLFGGRSSEPAPAPAAEAQPVNQQSSFARGPISCENQAKEFTQCLEKAPYESCTWYLEQLKAVSFNLCAVHHYWQECTDAPSLVSSARLLLPLTRRLS